MRKQKGVNKERGYRDYTNQGPVEEGEVRQYSERMKRLYESRARRGRRWATLKRADGEAIYRHQGTRREKKRDN